LTQANEKYIGDAILQKTYVVDFITKKSKKNNGEIPQYYVTGNHEGIIPKDIFNRVQEEMARRGNKRKVSQKNTKTEHGKYSGKYALSELLVCGECGTRYRRVTWARAARKKLCGAASTGWNTEPNTARIPPPLRNIGCRMPL